MEHQASTTPATTFKLTEQEMMALMCHTDRAIMVPLYATFLESIKKIPGGTPFKLPRPEGVGRLFDVILNVAYTIINTSTMPNDQWAVYSRHLEIYSKALEPLALHIAFAPEDTFLTNLSELRQTFANIREKLPKPQPLPARTLAMLADTMSKPYLYPEEEKQAAPTGEATLSAGAEPSGGAAAVPETKQAAPSTLGLHSGKQADKQPKNTFGGLKKGFLN